VVASACQRTSGQQAVNTDALVELKEFAIGVPTIEVEYSIPGGKRTYVFKSSAEAGQVTFKATNRGTENHELMVIKTDLDLTSLPTDERGAVDEAGAGIEVVGEIEEFPAGETRSASFDLEAGSYVLICNLVVTKDGTLQAHYKEGMRASFKVE
jgi:hypothetical protein